jgi:hypothetical protein
MRRQQERNVERLSGSLIGGSESRIVAVGLVFLLTLISGVWLSSTGRPLSVPLFTVHKLIALAATVLIALTVYNLRGGVDGRILVWIALAVTALLLVSLFATGALLSADKPVAGALLTLHRVAPILTPVAAAATIYLLVSGK